MNANDPPWKVLKCYSIEELIQWADQQTWAQAMAACWQDPEWHAEGDVWTHTKLVLEQLEQLEAWGELDEGARTQLKFVALFHDAAKPLTTEVDEAGRVRTPKHAVKGEHLARRVLRELGCDLHTRESIARLVRFHGRPAFLLEREDPAYEVVRMSWLVNNRLLHNFALADTRGRDTDCTSRPEETLAYWKLLAEEHDCYEVPYQFATDHARFTYFHSAAPNLHYVPHEAFRCDVIMMSGLPGSGKDHWLRTHTDGLPVVSLDELRRRMGVAPTENQGAVAQEAKECCREHLRAGRDFVFNATNTMRTTRQRWLELFRDYDARVRIVYLEPTLPQLLEQNRNRAHPVPEDVITRLADRLEPPTWLECHQLECIG